MYRTLSVILTVVVVANATQQTLAAAEPVRDGSISGTIDKPQTMVSVAAVNRSTRARFAGKFDRKSGQFTIGNLPLDATYDCVVDFGGARWEGINLRVPRSDYVEEQPLSTEDIATIKAKVRALNKFEDVVDVMAIEGNIQHAAILLNKLRTRPFFGSKPGEVVWRAELWHFERPEETWVKVQDELFIVLYRERMNKSEYDKKAITFDPALGGIELTKKQKHSDLGRVNLPLIKPGIRLRRVKPEKTDSSEDPKRVVR